MSITPHQLPIQLARSNKDRDRATKSQHPKVARTLTDGVQVTHHGDKASVTGSCHELNILGEALLIDCGLF